MLPSGGFRSVAAALTDPSRAIYRRVMDGPISRPRCARRSPPARTAALGAALCFLSAVGPAGAVQADAPRDEPPAAAHPLAFDAPPPADAPPATPAAKPAAAAPAAATAAPPAEAADAPAGPPLQSAEDLAKLRAFVEAQTEEKLPPAQREAALADLTAAATARAALDAAVVARERAEAAAVAAEANAAKLKAELDAIPRRCRRPEGPRRRDGGCGRSDAGDRTGEGGEREGPAAPR